MVGQQSVVRTLVNAIQMNRTHQAYVFSGSRGIGKTSIARIFSKALRCPNVQMKEGLLHSCDQCPDCTEIAAGSSVNVLEIDGASNNGVDSVREIRESAKFLPSSGKYKIYIVDEVHMLSVSAFNALLKTLEEPPEHVVFIFATTEPHKIPETILGRCQRFDFKRVTVAQITERVREVLKSEGIEAEEAALGLVARAAEGSMRDALSILDQVISFSGSKITAAGVRESIGMIGTELVFELLKGILVRDAKSALAIVQTAFNQGVDLKTLLKSLSEMLHALILIQVGIEKPETEFNEDEITLIRGLATHRALEENELIFQVLHHGLELVSRASQPKLIFDLLVIKSSLAEAIIPADVLKSGHESHSPRRAPRPGATVEDPEKRELVEKSKAAVSGGPGALELRQQESTESNRAAENPTPAQEAPPGLGFSFSGMDRKAPAKPQEPAPVRIEGNSEAIWNEMIEVCFATRPVLAILLESVVEWAFPKTRDDRFLLGFREQDRPKMDQLTHKAVREQFGLLTEPKLGFKAIPEGFISTKTGESLAEKNARIKREARDLKMQSILNHQIVLEARSLFGVELTEIKMAEREA